MIELDYKKLKEELIEIYKKFLESPEEKNNLVKARDTYLKYMEADAILPSNMAHALCLLVYIGYDINPPGKPSKETIKKIIEELET